MMRLSIKESFTVIVPDTKSEGSSDNADSIKNKYKMAGIILFKII